MNNDGPDILGIIIWSFLMFSIGFAIASPIWCNYQLEADAHEAINAHPGADWQRALIDARAWVERQKIK